MIRPALATNCLGYARDSQESHRCNGGIKYVGPRRNGG